MAWSMRGRYVPGCTPSHRSESNCLRFALSRHRRIRQAVDVGGVHPKIVSSRLGHATVAFTLDTYTGDVEDLDRDAAEEGIGLFRPRSQKGLT